MQFAAADSPSCCFAQEQTNGAAQYVKMTKGDELVLSTKSAPVLHIHAPSGAANISESLLRDATGKPAIVRIHVANVFCMPAIYDTVLSSIGRRPAKLPSTFYAFHEALLGNSYSPFAVVFEKAERMLELDSEAFTNFVCLHRIVAEKTISIVTVSQFPWDWFAQWTDGVAATAFPYAPCKVDFRQEAVAMLAPHYSCDIGQAVDLVHSICRPMLGSASQLAAMAARVLQRTKRAKSIVSGECTDILNLSDYSSCPRDLSIGETYTLFSAFIASFNPASYDVKLFGVESRKRKSRRRKEVELSVEDLNLSDLLPKPVSLTRLLAIFYFIVPDPVPPAIHVYRFIDSLLDRNLIAYANRSSKNKFKVNVERHEIDELASSHRFDLRLYLKPQ